MNKVSYEKLFRLQSMGDDVRVTQNSCKSIYDKVALCSKILNMPIPDVFINQSPVVNAFTTGTASPMIQIYSGLIDFFDDDELLAVIAHEMGHIKCGHVLYRMVTSFVQLGTSVLGPLKFLTDATIAVSLLEWERKSELSADRAALLVTQDIKPVISMLMKLAGGSEKIAGEIDYDDFLEQSRQYREMAAGLSGGAYKLYLNILRTHPFPVMRAAEIEEWSRTDEYRRILKNGSECRGIEFHFNNVPIKIEAISGKKRSIPLTWSVPEVGNISAYNIYRNAENNDDGSKNDGFKLVKSVSGRENNSYTDTGLEDGTVYYYYIKSLDFYNREGNATKIVSAKTKEVPNSIQEIDAKSDLIREIEIKWSVGYHLPKSSKINLYRGDDNTSKHRKIKSFDSTQSSYLDRQLKDGVSYFYWIRIEEDGLLSDTSQIVSARTKPLPLPPPNFAVKCFFNCLEFQWSPVSDVISYSIYEKNILFDKKISTTNQTFCRIDKVLKPDENHTYYVKSVDKYSRESEKSDDYKVVYSHLQIPQEMK